MAWVEYSQVERGDWAGGQVPPGPSLKSGGRSGWVGRLDLAWEVPVVLELVRRALAEA